MTAIVKLYCDFNDENDDYTYSNIWIAGERLATRWQDLNLENGSQVILYQDADDFEVQGVLVLSPQASGGQTPAVSVRPDWRTLRYLTTRS